MARYIRDIDNNITFRTDDDTASFYLGSSRYDEGSKSDFIYEFLIDASDLDLTSLDDIFQGDVDAVMERITQEETEDNEDFDDGKRFSKLEEEDEEDELDEELT